MKLLFSFLLPLLFFAGCGEQVREHYTVIQGEGIGTYYQITYRCVGGEGLDVKSGVDSILREMNQMFSIFLKTSVIEEFNHSARGIANAEFASLTEQAVGYARLSSGAFDPTVAPLIRLWGFGPEATEVPDSATVAAQLAKVGYAHVGVRGDSVVKDLPSLSLDYNGIAKGYAVDKIARYLSEHEVADYLVNVGGEISARGVSGRGTPWVLGIETPRKGAQFGESLMRCLQVSDRALATSGNYRSFHEKGAFSWGHTINPQTGFPESNLLRSATVLAPTCTMADALATALMVMGLERAKVLVEGLEEVEAVLIFANSAEDESAGFSLWYSAGMASFLMPESEESSAK